MEQNPNRYKVYAWNPKTKEFELEECMSAIDFQGLVEEVSALCESAVYQEMYIWDTQREVEVYRRSAGPIYG